MSNTSKSIDDSATIITTSSASVSASVDITGIVTTTIAITDFVANS
jgi:hypothetical protein